MSGGELTVKWARVPPTGERASMGIDTEPENGTCTVVFTVDPTANPSEVDPRLDRRPRARAPLRRVRLGARPMRIVVDVSPLSHPAHRDRELHPRLARRDGGGRGRPSRARRVRADEPQGARRDPRCAQRHSGHGEADPAPRLARPAHGVEPPRPATGRAIRRPARRFRLQRVDVPRATRRRAGDRVPRPRPVPPPGVVHAEDRFDAHAQGASRGGDVRRRVRQLAFHGRRPRRRPRDRRGADRPRPAGPRGRPRTRRRGRRPRRTGDPRARHDRAAEEPRQARRGVAASRRRARARPRGRRRMGRSAGPRRPTDPAARLCAGRGDRAPLPWGGGVRLPVHVRGLRDADRRGDGVRHTGRRVDPSVARRGVRRRGDPRRPARRRSRSRRGSATRLRAATSSSGSASRMRPGSPGRERAPRCSRRSRSARERRPPSGRGRGRRPAARARTASSSSSCSARPRSSGTGTSWRAASSGARRRRRRPPASSPRRPGFAPSRRRSTGRSTTTCPATPSPCASAFPPGPSGSSCGPTSPMRRRGGSRRSTRSTSTTAGSPPTMPSRLLHYPEPREAVRMAAAMRVAIDTTPLVQTRAGTARHVLGLLGELQGRPGLELVGVDVRAAPGASRRSAATRSGTRSDSVASPPASTSCTARPSARRSRRGRRSS